MMTTTLPQWRLACPQLGLWAGFGSMAEIVPCNTPHDPRVQVFDSRDDQAGKARFYTLITGIAWQAETVS